MLLPTPFLVTRHLPLIPKADRTVMTNRCVSDLEITPQLQQNKLKQQRNAITRALTSRVRPRSQLTADWFKASHVPGSRLNDAKAFIGPTVPKNKHPLFAREILRVSLMWKNSNI